MQPSEKLPSRGHLRLVGEDERAAGNQESKETKLQKLVSQFSRLKRISGEDKFKKMMNEDGGLHFRLQIVEIFPDEKERMEAELVIREAIPELPFAD